MGQKINPRGLRVGVSQDWYAKWFAKDKDFSDLLIEDIKIRDYIKNKIYASGVPKIEIERAANRIKIDVYTAKPGMVIGKGGAGIEELRQEIEKMTNKKVVINIVEVKNPELDAQLVAENIASQLERRISFRRAMKQSIARAMKQGAKGIKIACSGRLAGAEIARTERYHEGVVPLQTLRANIDYGFAEANTTYGKIGVKVWINKGEILPQPKKQVTAEGGK
ncbi:30S ribosomal protein S3 [Thermoanaerobacterium saccharolyticum]|uniref:Small ribosomal subunit protein uS3 n=3 Tax=Thermoanaerobacterium TaxID=28895 RepID=W9EH17_9THEO|nr:MULTISPECIES: 30S ribosomal protein S3 [Thermoanaerobacterium]MDI3309852.1 30S ribosomal protein S3 [Thermoanaerobacterium sp.]AEF16396.1 ribosomal protein S3 [Thermoanaerobacterium xylanolyticum LX-11]AFK86033.1 ribosomal protein S3 [Thermoanaerobacterium saccharolyticum JW/SL-YS485]ETO39009.1 30S ribosomal protein S3 [Thermoanaerobacterium aotearoense SCUT27]MDE4543380.1 30S ribosomal protein S3 [Thermoanaerobacterium sp. R66]